MTQAALQLDAGRAAAEAVTPPAAAALAFVVHGTPQPAGSKRRVPIPGAGMAGFRTIDDNRKAGPWKDQVAQRGGEAMAGRPVFQGALALTLTFYRVRPKGHFGVRGLRAGAPGYPTTKPDVTKLVRAVEDALTGVVWRDDAQVVDQNVRKRYGPERVEIEVREL